MRPRGLGPDPLGLPLGLGLGASAPPSRQSAHRLLSGARDMAPNASVAPRLPMPPSTTAEAAATSCSHVHPVCLPSMDGGASLPNDRYA